MIVTTTDGKEVQFNPGDVLDLKERGLIIYYGGREAEAQRMMLEERQKRTQETIAFVTQKVKNECMAADINRSQVTAP